jgi:hypothetical protein
VGRGGGGRQGGGGRRTGEWKKRERGEKNTENEKSEIEVKPNEKGAIRFNCVTYIYFHVLIETGIERVGVPGERMKTILAHFKWEITYLEDFLLPCGVPKSQYAWGVSGKATVGLNNDA